MNGGPDSFTNELLLHKIKIYLSKQNIMKDKNSELIK